MALGEAWCDPPACHAGETGSIPVRVANVGQEVGSLLNDVPLRIPRQPTLTDAILLMLCTTNAGQRGISVEN